MLPFNTTWKGEVKKLVVQYRLSWVGEERQTNVVKEKKHTGGLVLSSPTPAIKLLEGDIVHEGFRVFPDGSSDFSLPLTLGSQVLGTSL